MLSTQKVQAAIDAVEQLADNSDAAPAVRMAASVLTLARGQLDRLIPEDPVELDELLTKGSEWLLQLRSDPQVQT